MIDTHAHVYLSEFDDSRDFTIESAKAAGVKAIYMPAIDTSTHSQMLEAEKLYPGVCYAMMGLHPCSVKGNYREELAVVGRYLEKSKFIAIGETGLDFYWDQSYKEQQYEVLNQQMEWALHYDLPIVLHSRNSIDECIEVVRQHQSGKLRGVFHCFTGNGEQAKKIVDLGFYLGIGGVLTFRNSGLDKVIDESILNSIVLETDAPYLAPVPYRGKRNESAYLKYVSDKLAELMKMDASEIDNRTTANAKKLFGRKEKL